MAMHVQGSRKEALVIYISSLIEGSCTYAGNTIRKPKVLVTVTFLWLCVHYKPKLYCIHARIILSSLSSIDLDDRHQVKPTNNNNSNVHATTNYQIDHLEVTADSVIRPGHRQDLNRQNHQRHPAGRISFLLLPVCTCMHR